MLRYSGGMFSILKRLTAACAAVLSLAAVNAPAKEAAPAADLATPALWKVSDADTTIYLFGTVHALPPGVNWYHGKVVQAFEGSQELVTEIADVDPARMQQAVIAHAVLPEGETLQGKLTPESYAGIAAALSQHGLPPAAFDRYKPWYAAVALATLPLMKEGMDSANGVDEQLSLKSKPLGQVRTGLETAEYQLGLFDGLAPEVQQHYLSEVLRTLPEVKMQLEQIIAAWKAGDAARLADLINEGEDDPAMKETLLVGRNRHWADWVQARLAKPGKVFLAVGAGHLAGEGSLQDQLKARGIAATRVQ